MRYSALFLVMLVGCATANQQREQINRDVQDAEQNSVDTQIKRVVDVVTQKVDDIHTKINNYSHDVWIDRMKVVGLFVWSLICSYVLAKKHGYWAQRAKRICDEVTNGKEKDKRK